LLFLFVFPFLLKEVLELYLAQSEKLQFYGYQELFTGFQNVFNLYMPSNPSQNYKEVNGGGIAIIPDQEFGFKWRI
jgi:hypothetical protein